MSRFNDPHVVSLTYRLNPGPTIRFDSPLPVQKEYPAFILRLADEQLSVELLDHHATEESARTAVEPTLKAWEIHSALTINRPLFTFEFERSEIIDRNPVPRTGHVLFAECGGYVIAGGEATFTVTKRKYPAPPASFNASDEVRVMYTRYMSYLAGQEPLSSMAYACLTLLERTTGTTDGAQQGMCNKYALNRSVRKKLGDLISEHGSPEEARKLDHKATLVALTGAEKDWIERVIRVLIQRKAEYDADPTATFPEITLVDFPAI